MVTSVRLRFPESVHWQGREFQQRTTNQLLGVLSVGAQIQSPKPGSQVNRKAVKTGIKYLHR